MQLSEKLLAKASGRAEKSWVFRIREKSVNQISVFILRGGIIIIGRDTSKMVQMAVLLEEVRIRIYIIKILSRVSWYS